MSEYQKSGFVNSQQISDLEKACRRYLSPADVLFINDVAREVENALLKPPPCLETGTTTRRRRPSQSYSIDHERKIERLAGRFKKILVFPPLVPWKRYLIHLLVEDYPEIQSVSVGRNSERRTIVYFAGNNIEHLSTFDHNIKDHIFDDAVKENYLKITELNQMAESKKSRNAKRPDQQLYVPRHKRSVQNESSNKVVAREPSEKVLSKESFAKQSQSSQGTMEPQPGKDDRTLINKNIVNPHTMNRVAGSEDPKALEAAVKQINESDVCLRTDKRTNQRLTPGKEGSHAQRKPAKFTIVPHDKNSFCKGRDACKLAGDAVQGGTEHDIEVNNTEVSENCTKRTKSIFKNSLSTQETTGSIQDISVDNSTVPKHILGKEECITGRAVEPGKKTKKKSPNKKLSKIESPNDDIECSYEICENQVVSSKQSNDWSHPNSISKESEQENAQAKLLTGPNSNQSMFKRNSKQPEETEQNHDRKDEFTCLSSSLDYPVVKQMQVSASAMKLAAERIVPKTEHIFNSCPNNHSSVSDVNPRETVAYDSNNGFNEVNVMSIAASHVAANTYQGALEEAKDKFRTVVKKIEPEQSREVCLNNVQIENLPCRYSPKNVVSHCSDGFQKSPMPLPFSECIANRVSEEVINKVKRSLQEQRLVTQIEQVSNTGLTMAKMVNSTVSHEDEAGYENGTEKKARPSLTSRKVSREDDELCIEFPLSISSDLEPFAIDFASDLIRTSIYCLSSSSSAEKSKVVSPVTDSNEPYCGTNTLSTPNADAMREFESSLPVKTCQSDAFPVEISKEISVPQNNDEISDNSNWTFKKNEDDIDSWTETSVAEVYEVTTAVESKGDSTNLKDSNPSCKTLVSKVGIEADNASGILSGSSYTEKSDSCNKTSVTKVCDTETVKTADDKSPLGATKNKTSKPSKKTKKKKIVTESNDNSEKSQKRTTIGKSKLRKEEARKKSAKSKSHPTEVKTECGGKLSALEQTGSKKTLPQEQENETVEDDDWESNWNESGDCLNPELMQELESVTQIKDPVIHLAKIDYYKLEPNDIELENEEFDHIVEIYDFNSDLKTADIAITLKSAGIKDFDITWVDDAHALAVFGNSFAARQALRASGPILKVRYLSEGSRQSKLKARGFRDMLRPYKPRPETTAAVARNLVTAALGIKSSREQRQKASNERRRLKEAREEKKVKDKLRAEVWGD